MVQVYGNVIKKSIKMVQVYGNVIKKPITLYTKLKH